MHDLSKADLDRRVVELVDIANDTPSQWADMKETPATFVFKKAKRGPLKHNWIVISMTDLKLIELGNN